ncbi:MAG: PEP-CTERM sorting domain-containing protein [Crocosphaera sp.]|nr:PEP-CTERM sorting domain-containing protein [Crocosphaera sp.]
MKKVLSTLVGTSVLASVGLFSNIQSASAAIVGGAGTCEVGGITAEGVAYKDCGGYYSGNDKPSDALNLLDGGLFGDLGTWSQVATDDDFTASGQSGSWTLNPAYIGGNQFALAIKAGNSYSLYFWDNVGSPVDSGTFNTAGVELVGNPNNPNVPDLSHLTLYVSETTAVPEPLTILGAGAAISFGTAFKRKLGQGKKNDKKA